MTAAADVYSLGVVLYELLAGDVPFPGENFVVVALRHVDEPAPACTTSADVPPRLAAAVTRALAKDPARRFASMADFAASCARACDELAAASPGAGDARVAPHRAAVASRLPLIAALRRTRRRGDDRRRARALRPATQRP